MDSNISLVKRTAALWQFNLFISGSNIFILNSTGEGAQVKTIWKVWGWNGIYDKEETQYLL